MPSVQRKILRSPAAEQARATEMGGRPHETGQRRWVMQRAAVNITNSAPTTSAPRAARSDAVQPVDERRWLSRRATSTIEIGAAVAGLAGVAGVVAAAIGVIPGGLAVAALSLMAGVASFFGGITYAEQHGPLDHFSRDRVGDYG